MEPRKGYQKGAIVRVRRAKGPDVWVLRYRRYDLAGGSRMVAEQFSDVRECPKKSDAERKAAELRKRINDQRVCATFNDLADKYEAEDMPKNPHTRQGYMGNLKHLRARWGNERTDQIIGNIMGVQLWMNNLKDERGKDYSVQTRRHVRNLMHRIFEDAMLWGILPLQRNPIDLVEVRQGVRKKRRKLILTPQQIDTLLRDPKLLDHVKAMVMVAVCTGMRISEILGLRWDDIDFSKGTIAILRRADGKHLGQTKSQESEHDSYPMHPFLAEALRKWREQQEPIEGWLFGSAITNRPFHAKTLLTNHLKPAGKRAGLEGIGWHTFRHSYRAFLADVDSPLEVQQALMRHRDIKVTLDYGKFSSKRAQKLRAANAELVNLLVPRGA